MKTLTEFPEVDAAADAVRKAVDRLIDLALVPEPCRAGAAVDVLGLLGFRTTDALMAAYPRAETQRQREQFIHLLGTLSPHWHFDAQSFLGRIARDDPDERIRLQADDACRYLMGDDQLDDDDVW
jgi:hypothetical protein